MTTVRMGKTVLGASIPAEKLTVCKDAKFKLADASRRYLHLHVKLQLETQNSQHKISLSIAAIIRSWRCKNKKINGLN